MTSNKYTLGEPPNRRGAQSGRVIGADTLSADEHTYIRRVLDLTKQSGVLVGALYGAAAWDLRALILEKGLTCLVRLRPPTLSSSPRWFNFCHDLDIALTNEADSGVLACGDENGQLWYKRKFVSQTMADSLNDANKLQGPALRQIFEGTLSALARFHSAGYWHGHLSPSNLGIETAGNRSYVCFLDPGFSFVGDGFKQISDGFVAPEVVQGRGDERADIWCLCKMLNAFEAYIPEIMLSQDRKNIIERGLAAEPSARPKAVELLKELFGTAPLPSRRNSQESSTPGVGKGKIIEGAVLRPKAKDLGRSFEPKSTPQTGLPRAPTSSDQLMTPADDSVASTQVIQLTPQLLNQLKKSSSGRAPDKAISRPKLSASNLLFFVLIGIAGVLLWKGQWSEWKDRVFGADINYEEAWSSNELSRVTQIAELAVYKEDQKATDTIVQDALTGSKRPGVRSEFLKLAFNPLWEKALTAEDRKVALYLALSGILKQAPEDLIPIKDSSPQVLFALSASLPVDKPVEDFVEVDLSRFERLPEPFAGAYKELSAAGVKNLASNPARSLSHLLTGDVSDTVIAFFFQGLREDKEHFARLSMLLKLTEINPQIPDGIVSYADSQSGVISKALAWFKEPGLDLWKKVPALDRLKLITAVIPTDLTDEQFADLLRFPVESVRRAAQEALYAHHHNDDFLRALSFLSSPDSKLTRLQTISLVAAINAGADKRDAYVSTWFRSNPDAISVLALLVIRRNVVKDDTFNFEAARYVAQRQLRVPFETIKVLAGHPEALARAFAVSQLDTNKAEQRALLQNMATVEPNENIRELIKGRLAGP